MEFCKKHGLELKSRTLGQGQNKDRDWDRDWYRLLSPSGRSPQPWRPLSGPPVAMEAAAARAAGVCSPRLAAGAGPGRAGGAGLAG